MNLMAPQKERKKKRGKENRLILIKGLRPSNGVGDQPSTITLQAKTDQYLFFCFVLFFSPM